MALTGFEAIRVAPETLARPRGTAGYGRDAPSFYRSVTEAVLEEGARAFAPFCHISWQIESAFVRTCPLNASPVGWSTTAFPPREMDRAEMDRDRDAFRETAENRPEAGFDGIELHWGHDHLLQQCLSPLSNRRTDDCGGSVEKRMSFRPR